MKKTIEIIVPCYNEAEVLPIFFQTVCNISEKIDKYEFSFLFIDDGSIDNTLEIIKNFQLIFILKIINYIFSHTL